MIYEPINAYTFRDAFARMNRAGNYTYEGLGVLFDFLEDESEGADIEMDVIGFCCTYYEASASELDGDYPDIAEEIADGGGDVGSLDDWREALETRCLIVGETQNTLVFTAF